MGPFYPGSAPLPETSSPRVSARPGNLSRGPCRTLGSVDPRPTRPPGTGSPGFPRGLIPEGLAGRLDPSTHAPLGPRELAPRVEVFCPSTFFPASPQGAHPRGASQSAVGPVDPTRSARPPRNSLHKGEEGVLYLMLMIQTQVHLRLPCYDFCFL